ncbi:MAG: ABC transporter permease, partial [Halobacteriales archaeon]
PPMEVRRSMGDVDGTDSAPPIEPIDFDSTTGRRLPVQRRTIVFLVLFSMLAVAGGYEFLFIPHLIPPWGFDTTILGYLFYASLLVLVFFVAVPLARRPALVRRYLYRLRSRPLALLSIGYLALFAFVGTVGPWAVERFAIGSVDSPYGPPSAQPPIGGKIWFNQGYGSLTNVCLGPVRGEYCYGSWHFPLGTTVWGADVIDLIVQGFQVALQISLVTAMIIVPIATVVGTVAAYYGGWADELLMRYVDLQLVVPAVFLIIVVQVVFGRKLLHIVLVFGLLNWGGTARVVRAEALQRVEEGYVQAAESAGASSLWVLYRHVVPNVSNTLLTAITLQMPTLIIVEATISFLGYGSPTEQSWGLTINGGLARFPTTWWTAIFPAVFLFLTAVSFHVLGDALREIVDPQTEGRR